MSLSRSDDRDIRRDSAVADHLLEALETDDPAEKDYHIRSALQAHLIDG